MLHITRPLQSSLLPLVLLICLPGEARSQEKLQKLEAQQDAGIHLRESTKRILADHDLKRQARQEPGETIVTLERLRADGREPAEEIGLAIAEVAINGGTHETGRVRIGLYLCAADETFSEALEQVASKGPSEISADGALSARGLNIWAVEGLIDALKESDSEALGGDPVDFSGPLAEYRLRWKNRTDGWTPATHDYVGASTLERKKRDAAGFRFGLGAPIVAVREGDLPDQPVIESRLFPIYEYYYSLTAVLDFGAAEQAGRRLATLTFVDPHREDMFEMRGVEYPLAMDLGAQFVVLQRETDIEFGKGGALKSGKHISEIGLYVGEPLRTDKIPLVLVHGLLAGPTGWIPALEELALDPEIQQGYQVWSFAYPTGLPFAYSARLLREALVETLDRVDPDGTNPLIQNTVMVSHSMGGLLTRVNISDSGMVVWDSVFTESPDEIDLEPEDLEWMVESLIFESVPSITRAVFFSVPHRGSSLASNSVGKIGASFVTLPGYLKELGERIVLSTKEALQGDAEEREKFSDGIQTLQPDSTAIQTLNQLEINPRVTYHSIIGDQGKGDTPDSSDGIVPYWSSHLEGAASEKIVPSGHGSYKDPEGIAELQHILHEHLDSVKSRN
jgi:hypothetical protein